MIDGRIAGVRVQCELDSGASHCIMSEECAVTHGFNVKGTQGSDKITLDNGEEIAPRGEADLCLKLNTLGFLVNFTVVARLQSDVVLGNSFLSVAKAIVNYGAQTVTLTKGERHVALKWASVYGGQASHPTKGTRGPSAEKLVRKSKKLMVKTMRCGFEPPSDILEDTQVSSLHGSGSGSGAEGHVHSLGNDSDSSAMGIANSGCMSNVKPHYASDAQVML
jgi:hypothetical protein